MKKLNYLNENKEELFENLAKEVGIIDSELVKKITYDLVKINSITNTKGEVDIALYIYNFLASLDYFKLNKDNLILQELGDKLNRKNVIAIINGTNKELSFDNKSIVLLSHFDTVDIEDYQNLKEVAFDIDKITTKFKELIVDSDKIFSLSNTFSQELIEDINNDFYLFGRGVLDMKSGVAVNISLIKKLSENVSKFNGNIIGLFVSDEETNSLGMLKALDFLYYLKKEKSFRYISCIDTDYIVKEKKRDKILVNSYYGSVGKVLIGFYIKGIETHVGEPQKGLNPCLILAKIVESLEMNKNIILNRLSLKKIKDSYLIPPTFIYSKDLKESYSVKTPSDAFAFLNVLLYDNNIEKIINNVKKILEKNLSSFIRKYNLEILYYSEFLTLVNNKLKENYDKIYHSIKEFLISKYCQGEIDERYYSLYFVKKLNEYLDFKPRIILFLSPPFYPAVINKNKSILKILKKILNEVNGVYGYEFELKPFFPYISDLSFLAKIDNMEYITDNLVGFNEVYFLDFNKMNEISMDVFDIGSLGNDAHKFTERLDSFYTFNILPNIILSFILKILN